MKRLKKGFHGIFSKTKQLRNAKHIRIHVHVRTCCERTWDLDGFEDWNLLCIECRLFILEKMYKNTNKIPQAMKQKFLGGMYGSHVFRYFNTAIIIFSKVPHWVSQSASHPSIYPFYRVPAKNLFTHYLLQFFFFLSSWRVEYPFLRLPYTSRGDSHIKAIWVSGQQGTTKKQWTWPIPVNAWKHVKINNSFVVSNLEFW